VFTDDGGPLRWHAPLAPYQRDGIETLLTRREVLLADDMGLGKTVQTAAALRILCFRERISSALVVCPASLIHQWRAELRLLGARTDRRPGFGQSCRTRASMAVAGARLSGGIRDLARRRDGSSQLARAPQALGRRRAGRGVAHQEPRIRHLASVQAHPARPAMGAYRHAAGKLDGGSRSLLDFLLDDPTDKTRPRHSTQLRATLKTLQLRRKKGDVLPDLPPLRIEELTLELGVRQREAYHRAEREGTLRLRQFGPSLTITHVLELISRLKQICNAEPVSGESAKLEDISARLATLVAEGHRALIFSQFTDGQFGVKMVARALRTFYPVTFTGAMSARQRSEAVRAFRSDRRHKAMILSLRAGGLGLNLQSASYVFHLDRWWNPAVEDQAESRAHRMGQPYPVTAFRYVWRFSRLVKWCFFGVFGCLFAYG
jgi:hypothetical protein